MRNSGDEETLKLSHGQIVQKALSREFTDKQLIYLNWSLAQLEQAQNLDQPLYTAESLAFLNEIDLESLSPKEFLLYR